MTRILLGFAFLSKLELLLFKPHWDYQIQIWKKKRKDSGRYKMSPSCKWPVRKHINFTWPIENYTLKKQKQNQIKRQTNKTKTRTKINSRDFLIWQCPNFFWKGILLTCWQIHSAKALPLHCWHWGYWIYGQSMFHSWRDLMNSAHLLHCYFFLPQQL